MQLVSSANKRSAASRWAFLAGLLVSAALAFPSTAGAAAHVRLFIDPGHGGKDPGAVAGGVAEKHTNLRISKLVMKAAKRQGWKVQMSRYDDRFVPLPARSKKAARFKSTDFVSIHSNSMGSRPRGNMTIYRDAPSRALGRQIMREMAVLTSYGDLGNRRDVRGLSVLKRTKNPAVVVEVLSVSSPGERKALTDRKVQAKYAESIVKGIARHHGVRYVPPRQPKPLKKSSTAQPSTLKDAAPQRPVSKAPAKFAESPKAAERSDKVSADTSESQPMADKPEKLVESARKGNAAGEKRQPAAPAWLGALLGILTD